MLLLFKLAFSQRTILGGCRCVPRSLAGYSKWANIKHTKDLKDGQRSRMFTKLSQQIKVAIHEGGSAIPTSNLKLEQIIAQARRMDMPAAIIESAIKSTQKDKRQFKSYLFEIKGPGGCIILCEIFSPHFTKIKQDIAFIMKRHHCRYIEGVVQHLFQHKGIIVTKFLSLPDVKSHEAVLELATNHAITCEAEDVQLLEDSNVLQFFCHPHSFASVQKNLENLNYGIISATLDYLPSTRVSLSDSDLELCASFFDKLENLDDVVKLYDNIS